MHRQAQSSYAAAAASPRKDRDPREAEEEAAPDGGEEEEDGEDGDEEEEEEEEDEEDDRASLWMTVMRTIVENKFDPPLIQDPNAAIECSTRLELARLVFFKYISALLAEDEAVWNFAASNFPGISAIVTTKYPFALDTYLVQLMETEQT